MKHISNILHSKYFLIFFGLNNKFLCDFFLNVNSDYNLDKDPCYLFCTTQNKSP